MYCFHHRYIRRAQVPCYDTNTLRLLLNRSYLLFCEIFLTFTCPSLLLLFIRLSNIQPQAVSIKIELVLPTCLLQNCRDIPRVLNPSQINVAPRLLNSISNKFGRTCFSLCADNCRLFFLASFIDNKSSTLSFLLSNLFRFNGGLKFGGERKILRRQMSDLMII